MKMGECPICGKPCPENQLQTHVEMCLDSQSILTPSSNGRESNGPEVGDMDDDYALALKLQAEEELQSHQAKKHLDEDERLARTLSTSSPTNPSSPSSSSTQESKTTCQQCSTSTILSMIYILDDCCHKFCKDCLQTHVNSEILKSPTVGCPISDCRKALSVRDMKDLLIKPAMTTASTSRSRGLVPTKAGAQATTRLLSELKQLSGKAAEKQGFSVEPIGENLYNWKIKFFNFDRDDPLGADLHKMKKKHITLRAVFPPSYPHDPPFVRVIHPRFAYRTGHVTVGGSICMELLARVGWSPANSMEAVLMTVRAQFLAGGARLDFHNKSDYSEAEAKMAYDRMVREHGWG